MIFGQTCCWVCLYLQWLGHGSVWEGLKGRATTWRWDSKEEAQCSIWLQGPLCRSWPIPTPSSDLYQVDGGQQNRTKKHKIASCSLPLISLWFVLKLAWTTWSYMHQLCDICSSVKNKKHILNVKSFLSLCNFLPVCISLSLCCLHLCTKLPSLTFFYLVLSSL